jgi:hypothetical protein
MYICRIRFIAGSSLTQAQLVTPGVFAQLSPPAVNNPSDNFRNLFEIPVLFYALALYLFATSRVDGAYLTAAWVFVAFRVMHSIVHCTVNIVMLRFYFYLLASLAVWFIALRAGLVYLGI